MFIDFFCKLKDSNIPVTVKEYLTFIEGLDKKIAKFDVNSFYFFARTCLIKDEKYFDRFDKVFGEIFNGIENTNISEIFEHELPSEWLKYLSEKHLNHEEKQRIQNLGGFDKVIETLKERLKEQRERHEGGNKWIGTAGTSPFGAYGYNPEGVRIGQKESREKKAIKVWDKRIYKNLDDSVELGTRNIKIALRKLRNFARTGTKDLLDLPATIKSTAHNGGYLNLEMMAERKNLVKILLLLDIGGSMDDWIKTCTELFSAARSEFKNLEYFYFHNCIYDSVWRDNYRRNIYKMNIFDIINTYSSDWKVIFVGDASMSPYEISMVGGCIENWNEEPGYVWIKRILDTFEKSVWLNPIKEDYWNYSPSINMIKELLQNKMFPLTLSGIDKAISELQ